MIRTWVLLAGLTCLASPGHAARPQTIGSGQDMAVVVARYEDGDEPELTAANWCEVLRRFLNAYFKVASGGQLSFDMVPVDGVCKLPYDVPPESGEDWDLGGLVGTGLRGFNNWSHQAFRELTKAVDYAVNKQDVDFESIPYLLVFTERRGRAIATGRSWAVWDEANHRFVTVAGAIIPALTGDDNAQPFDPATIFVRPRPVRFAVDGELVQLQKILVNAISPGRLQTVAHEVGHLLGQSDLYNEFQQPGEDDFAEMWSLMGTQRMQHLDGYTRHQFGWVPDSRVRTLTQPVLADFDETIRLVPPWQGRNREGALRELVRLSFGPTNPINGQAIGPFRGLYLEARQPSLGHEHNLDQFLASIPWGADTFAYQDGLLVGLVTENRPLGPYIVQPRFAGRRLEKAPFGIPLSPNEQVVYSRNDDRIRLQVTGRTNDELSVRVQWRRKPMPDIYLASGVPWGESPDIWIDSPANGFGTFRFGHRDGDTVPDRCGDFPFIGLTSTWVTPVPGGPSFPGPPQVDRVPHRIHIRVRNLGNANCNLVRGHCLVIERPNLVNVDPAEPLRLLGLGEDRVFTVTNLSYQPGQNSREVVLDGFEPKGLPFMVIVWFEPATADGGDLEPNPFNQLAGEAVFTYQTSQGSPYRPVTLPLSITNLDPRRRELVYAAIPEDLPDGWSAALNQTYADVPAGGEAQFELSLRPPESEKPGTLRTPRLIGYVNHGCGFVPIGSVPVQVECCTPTTTSLAAKTDGKSALLAGRVSARREGLPVQITVTDNAGGKRYAGTPDGRFGLVRTARDGSFSANLPYDARLSYAAVASFGGAPGLEVSNSPVATFGAPLPPRRLPDRNRPNRPIR